MKEYIDRLCEAGNISWLKEELANVERVIRDLIRTISSVPSYKRKNFLDQLKYEKGKKEKIEKCIKELEQKVSNSLIETMW